MLRRLLDLAQENDKEAMQELIRRFHPLFRKYANKLEYEDAYEDIILWFIELVKSGKLSALQEEVIASYIQVSVCNYFSKKIEKIIHSKKEIIMSALSEEYCYILEIKMSGEDPENFFLEMAIDEVLNEGEYRILQLVFIYGYSSAEIAGMSGRSRQAVNQQKKRALKKIKDILIKNEKRSHF